MRGYTTQRLVRALLGANSALWLAKIGYYAWNPVEAGSPVGVLSWLISIEYFYLLMLSVHVVSVIANLVTKDRRGWVGELEVTIAAVVTVSLLVAAYLTKQANPENLTCSVLALIILLQHQRTDIKDVHENS